MRASVGWKWKAGDCLPPTGCSTCKSSLQEAISLRLHLPTTKFGGMCDFLRLLRLDRHAESEQQCAQRHPQKVSKHSVLLQVGCEGSSTVHWAMRACRGSVLLRPQSPGRLTGIRDDGHQTNEGQYKPVTCDSTAVLLRLTANRPSTRVQAPYQGVHPCWAAL